MSVYVAPEDDNDFIRVEPGTWRNSAYAIRDAAIEYADHLCAFNDLNHPDVKAAREEIVRLVGLHHDKQGGGDG
jgi:hypothetical protein